MSEPFPEDAFNQVLRTERFGRDPYFFRAIDSTNRFAKRLASAGVPEGTMVCADAQTKGRGRWGKTWESSPDLGLWFSLILRPERRGLSATLFTLMGAVSVATVLEEACGVRFHLQWPNDVMHAGKKVAGVLTETNRSSQGISYAVLGIGLNVNHRSTDFSPELSHRAASLAMVAGNPFDRVLLLAQLLWRLERDYRDVHVRGFRPVLETWVSHSNLIGKWVALSVHGSVERGRVEGFHSNGDLILASKDGRNRRFSDGHVLEVQHAACD